MTYALTWELDSLLPHPSTPKFQEILQGYSESLSRLAAASDQLTAVDPAEHSVAHWVAFLEQFEGIESLATDLNALVGCHAAADAANKLFQQLEGRLSALNPLRERIYTNLEYALKSASRATFDAFKAADPRLQRLDFFLTSRRKNAELRLPKDQELLVADLGVDGIHAWGRLYDRLSGELRVQVMERGEMVSKSPGQVRFDMAERPVRENNFFAADKAWRTLADTCADALNHISGTRLTIYRRLGLADHLEMPLRLNRMTRATLDAMWGAVTERKSMLAKFFAKKAESLGVKKLAWFDLQAPYPAPKRSPGEESLSYDRAAEQVISTFSGFSPEFGEFARMALTDRWIEVENRAGKRQGGFCTGFPGKQQSRIFMTFTNTPDSMSTLAHELGHAYHSHVLREQPLFLQEYPMNLAETASTFAEAVLAEERLQRSKSKDEQLSILDNMLSDSVAYLMNIHARFLFEDEFHRERAQGELSAARFCELMVAAQKCAFLNLLDEKGWNDHFWASKLHFYISGLPFYNFPYTFGYLLSLGLYALAAESGKDFAEQYRRLLVATGCQETEDAVKSTLGYDLSTPDFWHKSLDIVERRVEHFLRLAE